MMMMMILMTMVDYQKVMMTIMMKVMKVILLLNQVKFSWLVDNQEVEGGVDQPHLLILPGLTRS